MKVKIEIDERELRKLVLDHIGLRLGEVPLDKNRVHIRVKSKQNYKSEWEEAAFMATYEVEA